MTKLEQAARALLAHWDTPAWKYLKPTGDLMAALREALAKQAEKRPQNCGTGYCSCIECPYEAEQAEQEPSCNQHSDAPHGFARNASHNAGRYVCECEGWEPEQELTKYDNAVNFDIEQKPVAWGHPNTAITGRKQALMMVELEIPSDAQYPQLWIPLYAAPVRTKDLTDGEVMQTYTNFNLNELGEQSFMIGFARAVIAADRELNK